MKKIRAITLLLIIAISSIGYTQNWQLVWADEFTNGISSDWVFETGTGSNGWGNNELQYYRAENATVQNGQLVITARRENFGGMNYTSARMKTQGRKSWKYGKIEARIAMPAFQGVWPAFWMLGDNISTVGWPSCGEIDIMEHINTGGNVHGTIHWRDHNNAYANYGGSTNTNVTAYHVYSVEWDASAIRWYLDGAKYHEVNIANGINGTHEFHEKFFILLNMAIGGNWPGFSIDNSAFPASMYVDYVRVYQAGSNPPVVGDPNLAGTYWLQNRHSGLRMDVAGNSSADAANIHQWSANDCTCQQFEFTHLGNGTYRIIAKNSGKSLDVDAMSTSNGANVIQWPYWGGDNQQFIVQPTGDGFYKIRAKHSGKLIEVSAFSTSPGGNVQQWEDAGQLSAHWRLIPVAPAFSRTIQAEHYSAMAGVQLENTTDAGGGQNVGWIDNGDWMAYNAINFPQSGAYRIEYRVASLNGGRLSIDLNAGSIVLGAVNIPSTGGWQNWTTVSHTVNVNAGTYNVGIFAQTGGWNINWFRITKVSGARLANSTDYDNSTDNDPISVYYNSSSELVLSPNPATEHIMLSAPFATSAASVQIINATGVEVYNSAFTSEYIDIRTLPTGIYTLIFRLNDENKISKRFIKQ